MLYAFVEQLKELWSPFNVFRYITVRSAYATVAALFICFIAGGWVIRRLRAAQIGESIREEGPQHHRAKEGTPTMGGVLILVAVMIPVLLFGDLSNKLLLTAVACTLFMGSLGFLDDLLKLRGHRNGLRGRFKLLAQFAFALGIGLWMINDAAFAGIATQTTVPFFKAIHLDWGFFYIPLMMILFTGTANAVNLADGLDGLAVGLCCVCFLTYAGLAYVTGNTVFADYLDILYLPGAGELTIFGMAVAGACLGFLWFNCHPAEIFMGDTGSMALGGALASMALFTKHELLLLLAGGVFVLEALSWFVQVGSYKTRGKRVFKMAPIHHHFELLGWSESKVVIRFWIVGILLALLSLSTLKLR
ncbi:MAG TPA: phospho-N-acetylmuramoyl-pentapeptide-transferase [Candidatus Krumholzibacteria bacterium]|jgi:phospho-N-acetylmuramoyl-pentapeptide-transferase